MKKTIIAACCVFGTFNSAQVKCMDQQIDSNQECIQITYPGGEKYVSVQALNLEQELANAKQIKINNLSEEATNLAMQYISASNLTKLRGLTVKDCPLNDQFATQFAQIASNISVPFSVDIDDSAETLTQDASFLILHSLAHNSNTTGWNLNLPTINENYYRHLRDITNLNKRIKSNEHKHSKIVFKKEVQKYIFQLTFKIQSKKCTHLKLRKKTLKDPILTLNLRLAAERSAFFGPAVQPCGMGCRIALGPCSPYLTGMQERLIELNRRYDAMHDKYIKIRDLHRKARKDQGDNERLEALYRDKIHQQNEQRDHHIQLFDEQIA